MSPEITLNRLKVIIFWLLVLVTITQLFNVPGLDILNSYYLFQAKNIFNIQLFSRFPPIFVILADTLFSLFPSISHSAIHSEMAWYVYKVLLFAGYLLTFWSFLLFVKFHKFEMSFFDLGITYFASLGILLLCLSYSYYQILAAPFLILTSLFLIKKNSIKPSILYLITLSFCPFLAIIGPILYFFQNKSSVKSFISFILLPLGILTFYVITQIRGNIGVNHGLDYEYIYNTFHFAGNQIQKSLPYITLIVYFFYGFILIVKRNFLIKYLAVEGNLFFVLLIVTCIFLIFLPFTSPGNLMWPIIFSILILVYKRNNFSIWNLIAINIFVFYSQFILHGTSGVKPVHSKFFDYFYYIVFAFFLFYVIRLLKQGTKIKISYFVVTLMILINISLIPSDGSPDHVSWTQYSQAVVDTRDFFKAQTLVDQRYPPLNTVIMGEFSLLWNQFIGPSLDYVIATKISIAVFYLLTIIVFLFLRSKKISLIAALLVLLTSVSLITQTQGLADVNIYLIPTLFLSIYFLSKEKFFLSGFLFGITLSIKWQPIILVPIFGATLVDLYKYLRKSIRDLVFFSLGFAIVPVASWYLVFIQPGGKEAADRAFDFLIHGAPLLSGQALNLNWIATYILHIIYPNNFNSLVYYDGLNRQILTNYSPFIFQGLLFYIASFLIILKFWTRKEKSLFQITVACMMVFFAHQILNKSAYEKHIFYTIIFMLFAYLLHPTKNNRYLVMLFDIMTTMNLIFFYGFAGSMDVNRLVFGFDITIIFSIFYVFVFLWILRGYLQGRIINSQEHPNLKDHTFA